MPMPEPDKIPPTPADWPEDVAGGHREWCPSSTHSALEEFPKSLKLTRFREWSSSSGVLPALAGCEDMIRSGSRRVLLYSPCVVTSWPPLPSVQAYPERAPGIGEGEGRHPEGNEGGSAGVWRASGHGRGHDREIERVGVERLGLGAPVGAPLGAPAGALIRRTGMDGRRIA